MKKVVAPPGNETVSVRRISWQEFYKITGREPPKADNDNEPAADTARGRGGRTL
ncbi:MULTISPECIES: hypothetical protein [unclassified Mesorhizobium]|uniref:hypothetical protein n=1 Tax=unclassified Mesorhizobium TaxID=325217 RepID=UPI0013E320A6|nr:MULTISPECIES: hypothetical protein [unclassified Mesorhizobium]